MENYDFSGWATRNDLLCGDGRTIRQNAFKENDGKTVPLVWNHDHGNQESVLGHALLQNRDEGVYAYCKFNDTEAGQHAKELVKHGDVRSLSIYANKLKQIGKDVIHGTIRELSLVLAGANPGAFIDCVMAHGDDSEESMIINYDENALTLYHSDEPVEQEETEESEESAQTEQESETPSSEEAELEHSDKKEDETKAEEAEKDDISKNIEDVQKIYEAMTPEQQEVVHILVGIAIESMEEEVDDDTADDDKQNVKHSEGGNESMKTNVFDQETVKEANVLSHSDQVAIMEMAQKSNVGSFKEALKMFVENSDKLAHGLDLGDTEVLNELLPDLKLLNPGAPEILGPDQSWVMSVINKIHKSPYSRVRTRHADARANEIREGMKAKGYTKAEQKKLTEHIKLLGRSFDPQTIYIKDEINRDDVVDITDFSIVDYIWNLMKGNMYETLARTVLVGDGREDTDPDKIKETHIRSIWNDDELYTIHKDVDIAAAKKELQGSNTGANFGENYIYAEAVITAALYARETYKGSGQPDFYCEPHLVNVMLLARDLNGRRIYDSKSDLAKALNVASIVEIEQFAGLTRTDDDGNEKKLLGIFVNLADYQFGSTKGGEITKFEDFDIDFNKYKYLMETRLSGALVKPYAAIALEEPVTEAAAG